MSRIIFVACKNRLCSRRAMNNTKESRTDKKYNTLDEIEKLIGVDILESDMAYDGGEGLFWYHPSMIGDDIIGASIMNDQYAVGDLKNLKIENETDDFSSGVTATFDKGKKYSSTLSLQVSVIGDRPEGLATGEGETTEWDLRDTEIIKHNLKNVNTQATIYEGMTDGGTQDSWYEEGDGMRPMTYALMLYKGVEYHYSARVTVDTMKEFLNTLSEELDADGNPIHKATEPIGWINMDDFPTLKVGKPQFNAKDELVLTEPMTYEAGKGDFVEGRYDMYAMTDVKDVFGPMAKGQTVNGMIWFDKNQFVLEKGETVIFKKAEYKKLEMKNNTYVLKNTSGDFLSGKQFKEGKYEITVKFDKKATKHFGVIVRNTNTNEEDYSDNYINEIHFSEDEGMESKTFTIGPKERIQLLVNTENPVSYTIELKKID